jgi:conserved oligomeric Golgi complex subunit 4
MDTAILRQLTSISEVQRLLHEATFKERAVELELEQLLASGDELEDALSSLQASTSSSLLALRQDAQQLAASTSDTASLADRVSSKIRRLDLAQSRAKSALERIEVVIDRSRAAAGVNKALDAGDYEAAAHCIGRYLDLSEESSNNSNSDTVIDSTTIATETEQEQTLSKARKQVEDAIKTKGKEASAARDHAAVARFARLHAPLRLQQEGVELLVSYLRTLIADRAKADYAELVDGETSSVGGSPEYLGALTNLFKDVAAAISEHAEDVKESFGPDLALAALYGMHAETDIHGTRLLQRYMDHRKLQRLCSQIATQRRDGPGISNIRTGGGTASLSSTNIVEPRQIEPFLDEILLLCGRSEEYTQYLLSAMVGASAPAPLPPARETALRGGGFHTTVRELGSYYLSLEEYFMEESINKAIRIDEVPEDGSLTSSMVDDVFFVLMKAGRRAMGTGKAPSAVAILNQLNSVLATIYRAAIAGGLQGAPSRLASGVASFLAAGSGSGSSLDGTTTMRRVSTSKNSTVNAQLERGVLYAAVALNNAEVSASYTVKLRQQLEDLAAAVFRDSRDRERVKMVLADLSKTASDLQALATKAVEQTATSLMPALRGGLDEAAAADYSSADGGGGTEVGNWPAAVLTAMRGLLGALQQLLTPGNQEAAIIGLMEAVARRLEAVILQKRYTLVGALQLERDLRMLVTGLSDSTREVNNARVRERFGRLTQLATLLASETAREVEEVWQEGKAAGWRLTESDVRVGLRQRVDMPPAEVTSVRLD